MSNTVSEPCKLVCKFGSQFPGGLNDKIKIIVICHKEKEKGPSCLVGIYFGFRPSDSSNWCDLEEIVWQLM